MPKDKQLTMKVKLTLSGGNLMVIAGGGCKSLLDFMEHKGLFVNSKLDDE